MRRILGYGLAVVLAVMVGAVVFLQSRGSGDSSTTQPDTSNLTVVRAVVGSEKKPYFADTDVQKRLAELGYAVTIDTAGSREIATQDLSSYDLAFPASAPAADKIKRDNPKAGKVFTPFFSPMVVATWQPIVDILKPSGVIVDNGTYLEFDVEKYLGLVADDKRWTDLDGNTSYKANKSVLVSTTDVRRSNSAAMYQAVTSYVANGNSVVSDPAQVDKVIDLVAKTFLAQGYVENTSAGPFGNYLSLGMGQVPMVFAYESQFLEHQIAGDGSIADTMRLAYPSPDVNSSHTVVSLSDNGAAVGEALAGDEELARLAARYGFRPTKPGVFNTVLKDAGVPEPPQLTNIVDPPTLEISEALIERIAKRYSPDQPAVETPED